MSGTIISLWFLLATVVGPDEYVRPDPYVSSVWLAKREAMLLGNLEEVRSGLEELHQWKLDRGIPNVTTLGHALLRAAFKAERERDRHRTDLYLEYARKLAPDLVDVYLARAWLHVKHHPFGVIAAASHLWDGLTHGLDGSLFVARLALFGLLFGMGFLGIWTVTVLFVTLHKPVEALAHWIAHLLRVSLPAAPLRLLIWLLIVAPFLLLGAGYGLLAGMLLAAVLGERRDRVLACLMALGAASFPLWGERAFVLATGLGSPVFLEAAAWRDGMGSPGQIELAEKYWRAEVELEPYRRMLLAAEFKKRAEFEPARMVLEGILNDPFLGTLALNNLGGAKAALGDLKGSVAEYREAIARKPDSPLYHYNVAQVLERKLLMIEEGEREIAIAGQLDGKAVQGFIARSGDHPNRLVLDERVPVTVMLEVAWREGERPGVAQFGRWWDGMLPWMPPLFGTGAFGALSLLAAILIIARRDATFTHPCRRCGMVICGWCPDGGQTKKLCAECEHLRFRGAVFRRKTFEMKNGEVARHETLSGLGRAIVAAVAPGAPQYASGKSVSGIWMLGMWSALPAFAWVAPLPIMSPLMVRVLTGCLWIWAGIVLIMWVISLAGTIKDHRGAAS